MLRGDASQLRHQERLKQPFSCACPAEFSLCCFPSCLACPQIDMNYAWQQAQSEGFSAEALEQVGAATGLAWRSWSKQPGLSASQPPAARHPRQRRLASIWQCIWQQYSRADAAVQWPRFARKCVC